MQEVGWGVKEARSLSDDSRGAADLAPLIAGLRFPLSAMHVATEAPRVLGLLSHFPPVTVLEG